MAADAGRFRLYAPGVKLLSGIANVVRAWDDATPMASRQLSVWTMTPLFGVATILCLIWGAWGGAAISGAGFAFGAWRCWRLPTPSIRRPTRDELAFAACAAAVVAVVIVIGHLTGRV
jgi:hypothetical protein